MNKEWFLPSRAPACRRGDGSEGGRDSFFEGIIQKGGSGPFDQNPDLIVEGAVRVEWG